MGRKKKKKLGKLIPLTGDDQLLFLLSTGKVTNEGLAASCVPSLVEINETCFKVLMCSTPDLV